MSAKQIINTPRAMQSPLLSQAVIHNGIVYVSGNVGFDTKINGIVQGSVGDRARQVLLNLQAVLEASGSSIQNILKCNILLTSMQDFDAVNKVWMEMIPDPKPARTTVAVAALPMGTDIEIECTAFV